MNKLGQIGEDLAVKYLAQKEYQVLVRNYRYKRAEIDIIAKYQQKIIFIEVKARSGTQFGQPEEFVTPQKEALIQSAAENYLFENQLDAAIRFDIIAILKEKNTYNIEHIIDAF